METISDVIDDAKLDCFKCKKKQKIEELSQCREGHLFCKKCVKKVAKVFLDGIKLVRCSMLP